jgi:hypothetical protein
MNRYLREDVDSYHAHLEAALARAQPGEFVATWIEYDEQQQTSVATIQFCDSEEEAMKLTETRPVHIYCPKPLPSTPRPYERALDALYGPKPEHIPDDPQAPPVNKGKGG